MVLQQDNGNAPLPFDTGLPRTQSSEDVPRWLIVLGVAAACTLLVALLRYAIDLLGVVFLIILVGFSIRAVSDWLTEGESVSAWGAASSPSKARRTWSIRLPIQRSCAKIASANARRSSR